VRGRPPLDDVYPVIFLDGLVFKSRADGSAERRARYLALGPTLEGDRDVRSRSAASETS
jgi:transposase-like protein